MSSTDAVDGDSPFKRECKESTVQKMRTMRQLTDAIGEEGSIQFQSLLPLSDIITSIVTKNREAFNGACADLRSLIEEKKLSVCLQNLASIAEINFLEGFDTFISYIYQGNNNQGIESEEDPDSANTSLQGTPIKSTPRKRVPKRSQESVSDEMQLAVVPVKKLAVVRRSQAISEVATPKENEEPKPVRKSARRPLEDVVKFACVFNGCTDEFKTVKDLALHAERCEHKGDLVLNFRCSVCKRTFKSDKSIKGHVGSWQNPKCADGSIELEAVRAEESGGGGSVHGSSSTAVVKKEVKSGGNMDHFVRCTGNGCMYTSNNIDKLYNHVRNAHTDCVQWFTCLNCGETRASGKAIQNHLDWSCINAKIELTVKEKKAGGQPPQIPPHTPAATAPWLVALRACPSKGCKFVSSAARFIPVHFNQYHSPDQLCYRCSTCKMTTTTVEAMVTHVKSCANSHPVALVNGLPVKQSMKKALKKRGSSVHASIVTSALKRKRGRPNLSKKVKKEKKDGEEEGDEDMPVLEMINTDDEEGEEMEESEGGGMNEENGDEEGPSHSRRMKEEEVEEEDNLYSESNVYEEYEEEE